MIHFYDKNIDYSSFKVMIHKCSSNQTPFLMLFMGCIVSAKAIKCFYIQLLSLQIFFIGSDAVHQLCWIPIAYISTRDSQHAV